MKFFLGIMFVVYNGLLYLVDSSRDKVVLVFGGIFIFAMQHFHGEWIKRRIAYEKRRQDLVQTYFDAMRKELAGIHQIEGIRINIMFGKDFEWFSKILRKKAHLRMRYWTNDYHPDETVVEYSKDNRGNCWNAWMHKSQSYHDRATCPTDLAALDGGTRAITSNVQSILSTPIYRNSSNKPIAILNWDSISHGIKISRFYDPHVRRDATQWATKISDLLFGNNPEPDSIQQGLDILN